jgi:hypothetical protein
MAFQKIDKEFCLTDNSVNVYGYRLLSEGCELERFNPAIGFLMHKRELGIAVRWEDFRREGDRIFAKPVVNSEVFPNLAQQIIDGFYSAVSVGRIVALDTSDDPADKIEGQTSVTVKRWFPRECSIVDIPGNYNALAQLYDESDSVIRDLADEFNSHLNINKMDKKTIQISDLKLPNLSDDSTLDHVNSAILDLLDKSGKHDALAQELRDLKEQGAKAEVNRILEKGLADRKLTKALSDKLAADYALNPQGLQALVDTLPAQTMVTGSFNEGDVPEKYAGKTFEDLYVSGELAEVKKNYPDYYKSLKAE